VLCVVWCGVAGVGWGWGVVVGGVRVLGGGVGVCGCWWCVGGVWVWLGVGWVWGRGGCGGCLWCVGGEEESTVPCIKTLTHKLVYLTFIKSVYSACINQYTSLVSLWSKSVESELY